MRVNILLLILVVICFVSLRTDILLNLPIAQKDWVINLPLSLLNLLLIFIIIRKYLEVQSSLVSVLTYATSPLIAYYEFNSSIYMSLVTCLLISAWLFSKRKIFFLVSSFILIIIFLKFSGITLYSDPGIINGLNQLRGESAAPSPLNRIIENKISYLSLHFIFNFLENFSPAFYFTPEAKILGFSFSPPILFGFIITSAIGLLSLLKNLRRFLFAILAFAILILPSTLSKNSPDLERLIITVPFISLLSGYGYSKITNILPKYEKAVKLTFLILLIFQYLIIIFDISSREPTRLMLLTMK